KNGTSDRNLVHHLDFDAPTCENANVLPDDKVESLDADYLDEKSLYSSRKRLSADIPGVPGMDDGFDSVPQDLCCSFSIYC
ncbi:nuclear pore complex protein Nup107, partial [Trifolium medium]|nr:nuclear pore complex protein Nup107 [Trifolium medium]